MKKFGRDRHKLVRLMLIFLTALCILALSGCANPLGTTTVVPTNFNPGLSPKPVLNTVSPAFGRVNGNTKLTLTGTGFLRGARVTIGDSECTNVDIISSQILHCVTLPHAAGRLDVTLTNIDGQFATLAQSYTYGVAGAAVPGFGVSSGGGTSTDGNIRLRGVAGVVGNGVQPTSGGIRLYGGIVGIQKIQ